MGFWMLAGGLALTLGGAAVAGVADAWFARSLLIYLDAVEANVSTIVRAIQKGTTDPAVTGINLKRDRGQDRARALKSLGWLLLVLGLGLQLAGTCLAKF